MQLYVARVKYNQQWPYGNIANNPTMGQAMHVDKYLHDMYSGTSFLQPPMVVAVNNTEVAAL